MVDGGALGNEDVKLSIGVISFQVIQFMWLRSALCILCTAVYVYSAVERSGMHACVIRIR